jgi:hypothetical protein
MGEIELEVISYGLLGKRKRRRVRDFRLRISDFRF